MKTHRKNLVGANLEKVFCLENNKFAQTRFFNRGSRSLGKFVR